MDDYVRSFDFKNILTESVSNFVECNEVLNVNRSAINFTILHNNIRSINKNLDEFKISTSQLQKPVDCIVLTEHIKLKTSPCITLMIAIAKVDTFISDLQTFLSENRKTYDFEFIIGDLNIDLQKKDSCTEEYLDVLSSFGFVSMINCPTRDQSTSSTCIDHIFMNTNHIMTYAYRLS
nr:unnamed protein product [Callosobruchus analis]